MDNYLIFNGVRYNLIADVTALANDESPCTKPPRLADIEEGNTCKVGDHEFIVCEHTENGTVLLLKDLLYEGKSFGENNNYDGSNVDSLCEMFADELEKIVGKKNIILHTVDLTADDGLKDYGTIERRVSLLTADQCRRYVRILDKYKVKKWWWLITPYSTPTHEDANWIKCVSPHGILSSNYFNSFGVRPFCILNSDIFVSV